MSLEEVKQGQAQSLAPKPINTTTTTTAPTTKVGSTTFVKTSSGIKIVSPLAPSPAIASTPAPIVQSTIPPPAWPGSFPTLPTPPAPTPTPPPYAPPVYTPPPIYGPSPTPPVVSPPVIITPPTVVTPYTPPVIPGPSFTKPGEITPEGAPRQYQPPPTGIPSFKFEAPVGFEGASQEPKQTTGGYVPLWRRKREEVSEHEKYERAVELVRQTAKGETVSSTIPKVISRVTETQAKTTSDMVSEWKKLPAVLRQNIIHVSSSMWENPFGLSSTFETMGMTPKQKEEYMITHYYYPKYQQMFLAAKKGPLEYAKYGAIESFTSVPGAIATSVIGGQIFSWGLKAAPIATKVIGAGMGIYGAKGLAEQGSQVYKTGDIKGGAILGASTITQMAGFGVGMGTPFTFRAPRQLSFLEENVYGFKPMVRGIPRVLTKLETFSEGRLDLTKTTGLPRIREAIQWSEGKYQVKPLGSSIRYGISRVTGKLKGQKYIHQTKEFAPEVLSGEKQFPTVSNIAEYQAQWERGGVHGTVQTPKRWSVVEDLNDVLNRTFELTTDKPLSEIFKNTIEDQTIKTFASENDMVLSGSSAMKLQTKTSLTKIQRFFGKTVDKDFIVEGSSNDAFSVSQRLANELSKKTGKSYLVKSLEHEGSFTIKSPTGERILDISANIPERGFLGPGGMKPSLKTRNIEGLEVADPQWMVLKKMEMAAERGAKVPSKSFLNKLALEKYKKPFEDLLKTQREGIIQDAIEKNLSKTITDIKIMSGKKYPEVLIGHGEKPIILKRGIPEKIMEKVPGMPDEFVVGFAERATEYNPAQYQFFHEYPRGQMARWPLGLENVAYERSLIRSGFRSKPAIYADIIPGISDEATMGRLWNAYKEGPEVYLSEAKLIAQERLNAGLKPERIPSYKMVHELFTGGGETEAGYTTGTVRFKVSKPKEFTIDLPTGRKIPIYPVEPEYLTEPKGIPKGSLLDEMKGKNLVEEELTPEAIKRTKSKEELGRIIEERRIMAATKYEPILKPESIIVTRPYQRPSTYRPPVYTPKYTPPRQRTSPPPRYTKYEPRPPKQTPPYRPPYRPYYRPTPPPEEPVPYPYSRPKPSKPITTIYKRKSDELKQQDLLRKEKPSGPKFYTERYYEFATLSPTKYVKPFSAGERTAFKPVNWRATKTWIGKEQTKATGKVPRVL